jgi:hypothetical protein
MSETVKSEFLLVDKMSKPQDKINQGLDDYSKKIDKAEGKTSSFNAMLTKTGGIIAGAFSVKAVTDFLGESAKIAREGQGIENAFKRIGDAGLLQDLRNSVKGTVSDLELMQRAVQASNFEIPLNQMSKLFQFATKRAQETGESVDYLVNSIITGIGRKSPLILDNLGISAIKLKEKLNGVGIESANIVDITKIIGSIAEEELSKMGDIAEDGQVSYQQMQAEVKNLQKEIGEMLIPAQQKWLNLLKDAVITYREMFKELKKNETILQLIDKDAAERLSKAEQETKEKEKQRNQDLEKWGWTKKIIKATEEANQALEDGTLTQKTFNEGVKIGAFFTKEQLKLAKEEVGLLREKFGLVKKDPQKPEISLKNLDKIKEFIKAQEIALKEGSAKDIAVINNKYKKFLELAKLDKELTMELNSLKSEAIKKVNAKEVEEKQKAIDRQQEQIRNFIKQSNIESLKGAEKEIAIAQNSADKILKLEHITADQKKKINEDLNNKKLEIEQKYLDQAQEKIKSFIDQNKISLETGVQGELSAIENKYAKILEMEEITQDQRKEIISQKNQEIAEVQKEFQEQQEQERLDRFQETYNNVVSIAGSAFGAIDSIVNNSLNKQQKMQDKKFEDERKDIEKSKRSEKEKAKLLEKLDEEKAKSQKELAMKEWRWLLVKSIADTASSVAEALPNYPLAIASGITGAIQTGIIASNKPEFEQGGIFDGVGVVPGTQFQGDNVNARLNSGEGVLNPAQGRNIMDEVFRLANGGQVTNNNTNRNNQLSITIQGSNYNISSEVSQDTLDRIEASESRSREQTVRDIERAIQNKEFDTDIVNIQSIAV